MFEARTLDRRAFAATVGGLMLFIGGCTADAPTITPSRGTEPGMAPLAARIGQKPVTYLPYGVPVLDTGIIQGIPEPYSPAKHGPTVKDTHPQDNDANRLKDHLPKRSLNAFFAAQHGGQALEIPQPDPGDHNDTWRGFNLLQGRGISISFDLPDPPQVTTANPPTDWIAYTPTAMPHGGSCVEATGAHLGNHNIYGAPYNDAFGIWDWCNRDPSGHYNYRYWANSTVYAFRDPYVRTYTDESGYSKKRYWIQIWAHNVGGADFSQDCWETDIYNFNQGRWEEKWTSCGANAAHGSTNGWVMHETLKLAGTWNNTCYDQKSVAADFMNMPKRELVGGTLSWISLDDPYWGGTGYSDLNLRNGNAGATTRNCWTDGTWGLAVWPGTEWRSLTPNAIW